MELLRSGGIGMKIDGSRVAIRSWSFADLVGAAYRVRTDQISGPPWLGTQRFDIQAALPAGTTPDQVPEMLQTLLSERFHMVAQRSQKLMPVYALTVGKGRLQLRTSGPSADDPTPSGCSTGPASHRVCHRTTMEDLANLLTQLNRMYVAMPPGAMTWGIDLPTINQTGLPGAYDFTMDYGPDPENGGSVMVAVEKLGLKLEQQKHTYDFIVIEQLDKTPTEN